MYFKPSTLLAPLVLFSPIPDTPYYKEGNVLIRETAMGS
jgi:hypothetical protein